MSLFFHKNLEGKQINGLTFLAFIPTSGTSRSYWLIQCVCLNVFISRDDAIRSERTKSCGCLSKEFNRKASLVHGFARSKDKIKLNFFKTYTAIKQRCLNKNNPAYPDYGGRGITICKRWLGKDGFKHFRDDMWTEYCIRVVNGENISIDRWPNVNGDYKPSNCCWATDLEQARHKRISVQSIDIDAHNYWRLKITKMVSHNVHFNNGHFPSKVIEKYAGCTVEFLRAYLQYKFKKGMTWDNYGRGKYKWQIDHIKACHEFDLAIEKNRYKCFHYTNLQPLWGWENNEKH
jgi:hypothetical protein